MNEMVDPVVTEVIAPLKEPGTAVTYQTTMGGRQFIFQTYIPRDGSVKDYQAIVGKMVDALARLELEARIIAQENDLLADQANLAGALEAARGIEAKAEEEWNKRGKKGAFQLTQAEQVNKRNHETTVKGFKTKIDYKTRQLEEMRKKLVEEF